MKMMSSSTATMRHSVAQRDGSVRRLSVRHAGAGICRDQLRSHGTYPAIEWLRCCACITILTTWVCVPTTTTKMSIDSIRSKSLETSIKPAGTTLLRRVVHQVFSSIPKSSLKTTENAVEIDKKRSRILKNLFSGSSGILLLVWSPVRPSIAPFYCYCFLWIIRTNISHLRSSGTYISWEFTKVIKDLGRIPWESQVVL